MSTLLNNSLLLSAHQDTPVWVPYAIQDALGHPEHVTLGDALVMGFVPHRIRWLSGRVEITGHWPDRYFPAIAVDLVDLADELRRAWGV